MYLFPIHSLDDTTPTPHQLFWRDCSYMLMDTGACLVVSWPRIDGTRKASDHAGFTRAEIKGKNSANETTEYRTFAIGVIRQDFITAY